VSTPVIILVMERGGARRILPRADVLERTGQIGDFLLHGQLESEAGRAQHRQRRLDIQVAACDGIAQLLVTDAEPAAVPVCP